MSYVAATLNTGEEVLFTERISLWTRFWSIVCSVLLLLLSLACVVGHLSMVSLGMLGLALCILLSVLVDYLSTEYVVTSNRLIAKSGFIARSVVEIKLRRVESVQIRQGIVGRVFGYGDLVIAGAGNPVDSFTGINDPLLFRDQVIAAQDTFGD